MGNSASSGRGHHEETVDFGYLTPQGIYTGPKDWNQSIVAQLICERKLAPFYRPLEDFDESWDDEQILAHRKELPTDADGAQPESSSSRSDTISLASKSSHKRGHNNNNSKDLTRYPEAAIYKGAAECPICFLYYPPNINHSRCCDQAICTECFVQIKRAEPDPKHLVSEPASCPYCVQENFGVVYAPPPWRTGLGSEGATPPSWPESPKQPETSPTAAMKRPRKSFGADSPEVVTIDQIRPDWEAKLAAVRAAVARRANRRIIMRQVGDRLIPVGISSGRVHPLSTEDGQEAPEASGDRGSRRSRRRQDRDIHNLLGNMGLGGQDLEELMVMEAMRLSLLEHEEQQRRQREEEEKKKKAQGSDGTAVGAQGESRSGSEGAGLSSAAPTIESSPSPTTESASASSTSVPTASTSSIVSANAEPSSPLRSLASEPHPLILTTPPAPPAPDTAIDCASTESSGAPDAALTAALNSPESSNETAGPQTPPATELDDASVQESRPIPYGRHDSLSSSLAPSMGPSTYDVLSSSPDSDSAISHKPLLRSRPGTPPAQAVDSADSSVNQLAG